MSVFEFIKSLDLHESEFIVEGSGVLDALGIRESRDLDIVVNPLTFDKLQRQGYTPKILHGNIPYLEKGDIEVWLDLDGKNFEELMKESVRIKGYNFVSLGQIKKWKQQRGLKKDKRDLELIEKFESGLDK